MTNDTAKSNDIQRATGLIIVEVRNSNPNGDPERDGAPRKRRGDIGEISPVSVKRKMRDIVENKTGPIWLYLQKKFKLDETCFQILEDRDKHEKPLKQMIIEDKLKPIEEKRFVKMFWDGRVFGNTFLEEAKDKSKKTGEGKSKKETEETLALKKNVKTGVVHFGLGLSVAPVAVRTDFTLTSKAGVEKDKTGGMAPGAFKFVEHGIYAIPFFVNPTQASHTGCAKTDVDVALELIPYVYTHNRSLVRTQVEVLHAWYAEHNNQRGSCNDFDLIDALMPKKREAKDKPSAVRSEYIIPNKKDHPDIFKQFEGKVTIEDLMDRMG
ncbi:MAG: type I CRISPR-associated protein Cas7 [Nitrospirae bacterium]|nr:type I CRISPR-associated protein Cas7 [Nitrospirota bacterium]